MTDQNGSKKWMIAVRVIMVMLGLLQLVFMAWARFITGEVIQNKAETASAKSELASVKDDVKYIRGRIDSLFELRRR